MRTKPNKVIKRSANKYRTYAKGSKVKHEPLRDNEGNVIPEPRDQNEEESIFNTRLTEQPLTKIK